MVGQDRDPAVTAGIAAGLAGLVAFLVLHAAWIVPIWFIAPVGAALAAGGGAVVGAAYGELLPRLPGGFMRTVVVFVGACLMLLPAWLVGQLFGPIYAMGSNGGGRLLVAPGEAVAVFMFGLFGTATLTGAVVGLLVGRTRRAAGWTALAGLVLALGPGHNIPILGATPVVAKELTILAVVAGVAVAVLVQGHAWQARRVAALPA